ncbi:LCP family protein [Anaerosporobacter faecicola]|uniref:LCP family protein n=1 Tax=Anaerosporobacter faecicola TaxID=2718714 RepID=UPI00143B1031|nr:LCP family protein [Anaerosporobacter faecicola]
MTKKQRKRLFYKYIMIFLLLLSATAGFLLAEAKIKVYGMLDGLNREDGVTLASVDLEDVNLVEDDRIINILLVGSDKRASWTQTGRSDSAMIATLDLKHKKLKLTSLMRDMYLTIPGYGENRFNAAYSFGGVSLMYETIATNFGIRLDGYAVVDFSAFKKVINTIGGVKITLTDEEYQYLTTAYKKGSVLKLKPGMNVMNGTQALAYTRIRQDGQGDFGRTGRQRKVLQAIFTEAKSMSLTELIDLANEIIPSISTDLTNDQIMSYMESVLMLGTTEIHQFRIPIDDSYTQRRINNMAVLIPDLQTNVNALQDFIFN